MSVSAEVFLSGCPRRLLGWTESEDGLAVILKPRFGSSRAGVKVASWFGVRHYRIRLDAIGTVAWKSFDGKTPLSKTARLLRDEFGDKVEPTEARLSQFVNQMIRSRFIEMRLPSG